MYTPYSGFTSTDNSSNNLDPNSFLSKLKQSFGNAGLASILSSGQGNASNFTTSTGGDSLLSALLPNKGAQQIAPIAPEPTTPNNPLEQALLQMLQGGGGAQQDYEQALNDSNSMLKNAFGAQIGAINQSSNHAKKQTKQNNKQIEAMYRALGNNYQNSANQEVKNGASYEKQAQQIATNAQGNVTQSADDILNQQAALAQGLGVDSTTAQTNAPVAKQAQAAVDAIQQTGQTAANTALGNSSAQERYLSSQGANSHLEGKNRQSDLIAQLDNFLQGNLGKIADVKGQEGQALAANRLNTVDKLRASGSDSFNQKMQIIQLLASMGNQQAQQQLAAAKAQGGGESGLPKYLISQGQALSSLPQTDQQQMSGILDSLFSSHDYQRGSYQDGKNGPITKITANKAGQDAYNQAIAMGLAPAEANLLRTLAIQQWQAVSK